MCLMPCPRGYVPVRVNTSQRFHMPIQKRNAKDAGDAFVNRYKKDFPKATETLTKGLGQDGDFLFVS